MIVLDPLLHNVLLLRTQADMTDFASRFADRQNQDWMAFATITLGTTRLMSDRPLQQGSTQQFRGGQIGRQFLTPTEGLFVFHYVN